MKAFNPDTNQITEDGEEIAVYDPLTFTVDSPGALHHKTKDAIKKLLEDDYALEVREFVVTPPVAMEAADRTKPILEELGIPGSPMPPCPPSNPAMGDKTPEVVEWHRQYSSPEDFERKYRNRVLPDHDDTLENVERGLPDDEDEENSEPPKVIA